MRNSFGPSGVDRNVSIPARDTAPVASCHHLEPPSFAGHGQAPADVFHLMDKAGYDAVHLATDHEAHYRFDPR